MSGEYIDLQVIIIVFSVTVTTFLLISIIMWVIGFICGRCQYKRSPADRTIDHTSDSHVQQQIESHLGALDEQVYSELGLDLTENVAYISTQAIKTQTLPPDS